MYILAIVLILIACVLIILAVLVQNPKSGMAANFGASNQVMGVRQTADFLEKLTWGLAGAILVFSLVATMAMPKTDIQRSKDAIDNAVQSVPVSVELPGAIPGGEVVMPEGEVAVPAEPQEAPVTDGQ